ncbi:MAG: hypothetical protein CSA96_06510 [Bacteroidetes bacterium]|nr:MAG: hypothetical protein CSA96_06510 [Bacteroidota bacterium]
MRKVIQALFVVIIIALGYLIVESIMEPIRFKKEVEKREQATILRLKEIKSAQVAYKDIFKKYTGSFDTLISFVDTGSFPVIRAIGEIPEEWLEDMGFEKAREKALREGIISRETTHVPVRDSLFSANYNIDSLRFVPFCEGVEFNIEAGEILTSSNLTVQVVEVSAMYDDLLNGLDPQLIVNYKDERNKIVGFEGLKFGSMEEGTLTGNWE